MTKAVASEEISFRAICMVRCQAKLVVFVFSSRTRQWRAIPSQSWSDLFGGVISVLYDKLFHRPPICVWLLLLDDSFGERNEDAGARH